MIDFIRNRTYQWVSQLVFISIGAVQLHKCYNYTQLSYISHPIQISTTMDFDVVCTMVQTHNAVDDTLASYGDATLINSLQIDGIIRSWLQANFYNAIQ